MAVYSQLLVNAGGGIINRDQQSERQEGATVAIGLGGTGTSALRILKRKVYRKLKPDNPDSPVPTYDNIRFLAIDSDDSKFTQDSMDFTALDKNTEYFDISNKAIKAIFAATEILANRKELDWLNYENITIEDAANGAGGIRQVGRFLLTDKSTTLRAKIESTIQSAVLGTNGDLNIHIFSGLSGGTGSGCFLDVCYIVRNVLQTMGRSSSARICGYFFLPDVNLSVPEVSANPLISSYIKVNGYAALQELDYMMDLGNNGEVFRQNYGTFEVVSEEKPVDLCYLISSTDANGRLIAGGYDYAMHVATDFTISFLAKVTLPPGTRAGADDGGMTLAGHISNLEQAKNQIKKKHGASIDYNILGASNAEMPLTEISTYLGAKLFEKFEGIYGKAPIEKELMEFVSKSQLSFENIMGQLIRGINWQINFPKWEPKLIQAGNAPAVNKVDTWLADVRGKLEENCRNLSEPLNGYQIPKSTTSLTGRTYKNLYDTYTIHMEKGPFFAMRLLGGKDNKNLLHVIDGYLKKNKELLEAENRQNNLRVQDVEEAEARLKSANFLNIGGRLDEYLKKLALLYQHHAKVCQYEIMDDLLTVYRKQVVELNNNFFKVLTTVLDSLKETFKENARILTNGERRENTYTWNILSIPDIQEMLDDEVKGLDVEQVLHSFMDKMFAEYPNWMNQDENKIARLVSNFILDEFDSVTRKTISDYLRVKFETDNPAMLSKEIEKNIIQKVLENNSEPLFWKNPMFQMGEIASNCTLSVPNEAAEIVAAAQDFIAGKPEFSLRRTGITDRLSMMRFYTGVPLYSYQGLQELEKAHDVDFSAGLHLYEKGRENWKEFLPSPIPDSFKVAGHEIKQIQEKNAVLKDQLKRAMEAGIVCRDVSGYFIRESGPLDLEAYLKQFGEYKENETVNQAKLESIIAALKQLKAEMYLHDCRIVRINVKGANEADLDTVLVDNYLRYPKLNRIVQCEFARIKAVKDEIVRKEAELEVVKIEKVMKEKFFNALFTGTLTMLPTKIIYSYEEFGIESAADLQNAQMPYAKCAVYQAFLTYKEMDPQIRERIDAETAESMNNMDENIYGKALKVRERHQPDMLKFYLSSVSGDRKQEEITQFYKELMKALQYHIMMYKM